MKRIVTMIFAGILVFAGIAFAEETILIEMEVVMAGSEWLEAAINKTIEKAMEAVERHPCVVKADKENREIRGLIKTETKIDGRFFISITSPDCQ